MQVPSSNQASDRDLEAKASDAPRSAKRGYALLAVLLISVLITVGATTLVLVSRQSTLAGIADKQSATAHAVAIAGLTWATSNMGNPAGLAVLNATAAGTDTAFGTVTIHAFDGDGEWAGVTAAPPAVGATNSDWVAYGGGHYAIFAAKDPLDTGRSVLIRSLAIVRKSRVFLETNLVINKLQTVPSGITGCFDEGVQITFYDQESPYDYSSNFRLDGHTGVPMALAIEHNRVNGLSRCEAVNVDGSCGTPTISSVSGEPQNVTWRGTQNLRTPPATPVPAAGVANQYGGVHNSNWSDTTLGPLTNWEANPFHTNDPRLVDTIARGGLGMNPEGWVYDGSIDTTSQERRGVPFIGTKGAPTINFSDPDNFAILRSDEWSNREDDQSRKGFYACDNHDAEGNNNDLNSIEACLKSTLNNTAPNFTESGVNHSGRAFGFIQMVSRQCTGSGSSINRLTGDPWYDPVVNKNGIVCAQGFEYLGNLAACLVVPQTVSENHGTNPVLHSKWDAGGEYFGVSPAVSTYGDNDETNNFAGCHPGCLIAIDADGDGNIDDDDRPYRSHCVNIDPTKVTAYGPGIFSGKGAGIFANTLAGRPYGGSVASNDDWQEWNYSGTPPPLTPGSDYGGPAEAAVFKQASSTLIGDAGNRRGGAVAEFGNLHFVTRLDMSDRGPLGTCEQNCLAYGYGRDMTYGAHRTDIASPGGVAATIGNKACSAVVPTHTTTNGGTATVLCNYDYNGDGLLDRKSYALHSSYREKCADDHDGIAQAPAFNISSSNGNIVGGCLNDMPNFDISVAPQRITPFCDDGSTADLNDSITALLSIAVDIADTDLESSANPVVEGAGWFGGAKCHMGNLTFEDTDGVIYNPHGSGHTGPIANIPVTDVDHLGNPDYWIEDECPDPGVWRLSNSDPIDPVGNVCGCGILIIPANSLVFNNSHFLWRGLIIWDLQSAGGELLQMDNSSARDTWVVQGGMVMYGSNNFEVKITKQASHPTIAASAEGSLKQLYVFDEDAISDAFNKLQPPVRTVRRIQ